MFRNGARPLERASERLVQDPLALRLPDGEGDTMVREAKRGQIGFGKAVDACPWQNPVDTGPPLTQALRGEVVLKSH